MAAMRNFLLILLSAVCCTGCRPPSAGTQMVSSAPVKQYTCQVVRTFPHDTRCYTQGLVYDDGVFYETGGLYGESVLRKVQPETGVATRFADLSPQLFAEGLALFGDRLLMLTWREHVAYVFDKQTFRMVRAMDCPTEGWGAVFDGTDFIVSDGSSTLYRRDTATFAEKGRIYVTEDGSPVSALNELEIIEGEIWANVYMTDRIVRIDPATGHVTGSIDCRGLLLPADRKPDTDVLNGIAYDSVGKRIFITGKKWPKLFEIKLSE